MNRQKRFIRQDRIFIHLQGQTFIGRETLCHCALFNGQLQARRKPQPQIFVERDQADVERGIMEPGKTQPIPHI